MDRFLPGRGGGDYSPLGSPSLSLLSEHSSITSSASSYGGGVEAWAAATAAAARPAAAARGTAASATGGTAGGNMHVQWAHGAAPTARLFNVLLGTELSGRPRDSLVTHVADDDDHDMDENAHAPGTQHARRFGAGLRAVAATGILAPREADAYASSDGAGAANAAHGSGGGDDGGMGVAGSVSGLAAQARSRAHLTSPRRSGALVYSSSGGAASPPITPSRAARMAVSEHLSGLSPLASELLASPRHRRRRVPKVPYKVLDAPGLADDFYLNVLDWSSQNVLCVGLTRDIYLWSGVTAQVTKLAEVPADDAVTALSWTHRGGHIAVGCNSGKVLLYDAATQTLLRVMDGHAGRCTSLSWAAATLATGARDRQIFIRDVRAASSRQFVLSAHKHEVCGLRWRPDWSQLASGGNDNRLMVWSAAMLRGGGTLKLPADAGGVRSITEPLLVSECHKAAVKALAWSPHQSGILASGGGTHDKCIRFTNVATGAQISSVDTGAQVTSLMWCPNALELASTHGFSLNCLTVWRYPSMARVATLTGHNSRVLYSALAPDGENIVTGAGDETLRFWHAFPPRSDAATDDAILPSSGPMPASMSLAGLPGLSSMR